MLTQVLIYTINFDIHLLFLLLNVKFKSSILSRDVIANLDFLKKKLSVDKIDMGTIKISISFHKLDFINFLLTKDSTVLNARSSFRNTKATKLIFGNKIKMTLLILINYCYILHFSSTQTSFDHQDILALSRIAFNRGGFAQGLILRLKDPKLKCGIHNYKR